MSIRYHIPCAIFLLLIPGLEGSLSSDLDAKLAPEHLFRLCLEHEQKFNLSRQSAHAYNFYKVFKAFVIPIFFFYFYSWFLPSFYLLCVKDPNAPEMAKMVEGVIILQDRIVVLLNEWDDHPALQKILDVIEMILAIPLSTPLAKVVYINS